MSEAAYLAGYWRDGTKHLVTSRQAFIQRLAAPVPRPHLLDPGCSRSVKCERPLCDNLIRPLSVKSGSRTATPET